MWGSIISNNRHFKEERSSLHDYQRGTQENHLPKTWNRFGKSFCVCSSALMIFIIPWLYLLNTKMNLVLFNKFKDSFVVVECIKPLTSLSDNNNPDCWRQLLYVLCALFFLITSCNWVGVSCSTSLIKTFSIILIYRNIYALISSSMFVWWSSSRSQWPFSDQIRKDASLLAKAHLSRIINMTSFLWWSSLRLARVADSNELHVFSRELMDTSPSVKWTDAMLPLF